MTDTTEPTQFVLEVSRHIRASPERLFAAWTDPVALMAWWGPKDVTCTDAAVELREGGRYFIDNTLPDGTVLRIEGELERIEPPSLLIYSWRLGAEAASERVTVRFAASGNGTDVTIVHERIATRESRDEHEHGWRGCLDGLEAFSASEPALSR